MWEKKGQPLPPPHLRKQQVLLEYANRYQLRVLVETGTYRGDMIQAMLPHFDRLYTIELSPDYHRSAVRRFRNAPQVQLILGDSRNELPAVLRQINQPALIWLDGHYSGGRTAKGISDSPVLEELRHVFQTSSTGHVMIIDDAHLFGIDPDYPSTEQLEDFLRTQCHPYACGEDTASASRPGQYHGACG
ncbi:MAG: class I SAM-dependent methyltransferase [Phycisphaerales bacterium]|nr:class I SAM-dependent methyltransferase [Phycisphaerales bacterium]